MSGITPLRIRTVLGIATWPSGFGFVVLETRGKLVSWGIARLYSKDDEEFLERIDALTSKYQAEILGFENVAGTVRSDRTKRRTRLAAEYVTSLGLKTVGTTRSELRLYLRLSADATKLVIAEGIAGVLPDLANYLPQARRPWTREADSMKIFEAAGFALAAIARL